MHGQGNGKICDLQKERLTFRNISNKLFENNSLVLSFHWWNGHVHLSDVRSACAKAADFRFYCFCTIYILITLEVPLLSVSNFCQDSKWKCPFDVLPKKGGIRSITCCCVWTHHYHHKGSGLVCSAGFFRRMRAPELAQSWLWCMCKSPQMLMNLSGYQFILVFFKSGSGANSGRSSAFCHPCT